MPRKQHLTAGWCWRADDGDDVGTWGIYGHVEDAEARAIVDAYEGEPVIVTVIARTWERTVPCSPFSDCGCGESHLCRASGPGRGASPITWVEGTP